MGEFDRTVRGQHGLNALATMLLSLEEDIPFLTGKKYDGHTLTHKGNTWLLTLRGSKNRVAYVAFLGGSSPVDCYRSLYSFIYTKGLQWRFDKYRNMT